MFDISYAVLSKKAQEVFLDLALYLSRASSHALCEGYAWIQSVHWHLGKKRIDEILFLLKDLSFIHWQHDSDRSEVRMHDLMVDFAKYKVLQAAAAGFNPLYLVLENGAHLRNPEFGFLLAHALGTNEWPSLTSPKSVRTVSISGCPQAHHAVELDLRNLGGVEVLQLVDNPGVQEVLLSRTTLAHLRSFIVRVPCDGTLLRCTLDEDWPTLSTVRQWTPGGQLVWVELQGNVLLTTRHRKQKSWSSNIKSLLQRSENSNTRAPVFDLGFIWPLLGNLQYLALSDFPAQSIDVTACTNLKKLRLRSMPSLRDIYGLEKLTNLDKLAIINCGELVVLSISTSPRLSSSITACGSLERISLHTMSNPEDDCSRRHGRLRISECGALRNVHGITQYTGSVEYKNPGQSIGEGWMEEAIGELVESVETGSSMKFRAKVKFLVLTGGPAGPGLAGVCSIHVKDAQHVGLLLAALCKVQATGLRELKILCRKDGDCGCDKLKALHFPKLASFSYQCLRVKDLESVTQLGDSVGLLDLRDCRSVEVWPDFAAMTSLYMLDLSYTSLNAWPTGVCLLPFLMHLHIQGCLQIPAEEMVKASTCNKRFPFSQGGIASLESLLWDLQSHIRDRCSVADALDSQCQELVALFHEQWRYLRGRTVDINRPISLYGYCIEVLIELMYELWFGRDAEAIMDKMRRLLCSEIFMSFPFYVWRIGRTRDKQQEYPQGVEDFYIFMALALVGAGSIGCFNAFVNDDLKDGIVNFLQSFVDAPQAVRIHSSYSWRELSEKEHEKLVARVANAMCEMARVPGVAAELGEDFMHTTVLDGLKTKIMPKIKHK